MILSVIVLELNEGETLSLYGSIVIHLYSFDNTDSSWRSLLSLKYFKFQL